MKRCLLYPLTLFLCILLISMVSCSKESQEPEEMISKNSYKISVHASFAPTKVVADGGTATFSTSEKIYVCNTSRTNAMDSSPLQPTSDGASSTLEGTLQGTYNVGDVLYLLYNSNELGVINYASQNGMLANVADAAIATVTVKSVSDNTIETTHAQFENLQSIFKLTFKKKNNTTINVKTLKITSENNKLVQTYNAVNQTNTSGSVTISNPTAQPIIYASLRFEASANDPITFEITDENDNVYIAKKIAPNSGFLTSKFYTSTLTPLLWSISATKQVYIAPHNLMRKDDVYSFASSHYPYTYSGTDCDWGYGSSAATANPTQYFQWKEIISDGVTADSPKYFTIEGFSDWKALKDAEWAYILTKRTMTNDNVARFYRIVDKSGRVGVLIPKDNATPSDVEGLTMGEVTYDVDYEIYEAKGLAFLPASGCNVGYWGRATEEGDYWNTSTSIGYGRTTYFRTGYVNTGGYFTMTSYLSVRLAREVN